MSLLGKKTASIICIVIAITITMICCNRTANNIPEYSSVVLPTLCSVIDTLLVTELLNSLTCKAVIRNDQLHLSSRGLVICNYEKIGDEKCTYSHEYFNINNEQYTRISYSLDHGLDTKTEVIIMLKSPAINGINLEDTNKDTLLTSAFYIIAKSYPPEITNKTLIIQSNIDSTTLAQKLLKHSNFFYINLRGGITIDYSNLPHLNHNSFYRNIYIVDRPLDNHLPHIEY